MSFGGQKSVSYKEIVENVCDRIGEEYTDLSESDTRRLRRGVQTALEFIWDHQVWPMLRRFERRLYYPEYSAEETLAVDAIRYSETGYWKALAAGTLETPSDDSAQWKSYTVSTKLIPMVDGESEISIPKTVYNYDPRETDSGRRIPFTLTAEGLYLRSYAPDVVWVEFMPPVPNLKGDTYDESTAYAAGAQCYYEAAGDFFVALETTTGDIPGEAPLQWQRLTIPPIFKGYIVWEVLGGEYSGEGQTKQRLAAEVKAEDMLYRAIEIARGMTGTASQPLGGGQNR